MTKFKRSVGIVLVLAAILSLLPLSVFASAGSRLTGDEKVAYDALVPVIRQIAAGKRSSTVVSVGTPLDYYPVDVEATFTGTCDDFDLNAVLDALTADHPYEMFWYGYNCQTTMRKYQDGSMVQATFYLNTSTNHMDGDSLAVSGAAAAAAAKSAAAAQAVVKANAGKSDYDKLVAYRDYICAAVTYDTYAANYGVFAYDNSPWQMMNVFDNNSATNVVCEGYSKAFKYLCDLSTFNDPTFECRTITGYMAGGTGAGGHMWNIVTLDGKHYLVDITNSDAGTIGQGGELFLAGSSKALRTEFTLSYSDGTTGTVFRSGYRFLFNGATTVDFYYDEDAVALWDSKSLVLSSSNYVPDLSYCPNGHRYSGSSCTLCSSAAKPAPTQLATPKITKLENTASGIKLTWGAVKGATQYKVFIKTSSGWKTLGTTTGTNFTYKDAKSGSTYTFTVRCVDASGNAVSSYNATGWKQKFVAQPSITKLESTASGIKLTWGAVKGAERYKVYVKTSSGWKALGTTIDTSFTYTAAKSGTTYTFTVRCVNAAGSANTSSYNATGWKHRYISQPSITKRENTASGIKLTWNAVKGAERYKVYLKTASGWKALGTTTGTSFTYKDAQSNTSYTFTVRCVDASGKAVSSYNTTGWKQKYISQPSLKLQNTASGIKLTWNAVKGAQAYRIYIKTGSGWKSLGAVTGTSFLYKNAKPGATYTFTIRCVNAANTAFTSSYNTTGWKIKRT